MLEQISWKDFLIVVGGGCVAYYGILLIAGKLRFSGHRNPIVPQLHLPHNKSTASSPLPTFTDGESPPLNNETTSKIISEEDAQFSALEAITDEIQVIITQIGATAGTKEELLLQLRQEIARYPTLNKPAFRRAITNVIKKIVVQECHFILSEQETRECWPV